MKKIEKEYIKNQLHEALCLARSFFSEVWYFLRKDLWHILKHGYSCKDTWSLDIALAKWLIPRLKELRKNKVGVPYSFCFKGDKQLPMKEAEKNWDKELRTIIIGLELYLSEVYGYVLSDKERKKTEAAWEKLFNNIGNLWT